MHPFNSRALTRISAAHGAPPHLVGAKAYSLQKLSAAGFPVPPALVLNTEFFEPWFAAIAQLPSWAALPGAAPEQRPALCAALKADAATLSLTDDQRGALAELADNLPGPGQARRYAVRSSSPDEDAAAASFAGLFETLLGVAAAELENAIRHCFAASLDHRVFAYRAARGMALERPSMALIVQLQLDSEAAGVGFSINPLSNDFDEAVFDANWGLGESVVSGLVSPDHFVLDKASGAAIARVAGSKHLAVRLAAHSGTASAAHPRRGEFCLDDAQLRELSTLVCRVEALYGHPVDIEWAYAEGKLYILQARPVTAWVPLPAVMLSAPGEPRTLYMDIALSKGMTSNEPISPMGLDWLAGDMGLMLRHATGGAGLELSSPHGLLYLGGGRMYMNLSNLLCFCSPAQLAKGNAATDQLMADTLAAIDPKRYRAARRPAWIWPALRVLPGALWRLRRALWHTVRALIAPASTCRKIEHAKLAFEQQYGGPFDHTLPLPEFQRRYGAPAIAHVVDVAMPALGVGVIGIGMLKWLAGRDDAGQALAAQAARGIGGNLVVDMGIAMYRMARMLDAAAFDDLPLLHARLVQRDLPAAFLLAWDSFMRTYGCRGPGEMDLATPRYGDQPMLVLRQMSFMAKSSGQFDPEAAHQRLADERRQACLALAQRSGWARRLLLRRANTLIDLFGGARDTPKQHNLLYQQAVRTRLLREGARLAGAGRLARPEQIFSLTLADLAQAECDRHIDLNALCRQRTAHHARLRLHVRSFPAVIDSRGRILRPARAPEQDGELRGMAVSPGIVRGKVKLMHNAHDKRIDQGDILIAFTTDPGWTPLFVNAAAVVLEVGGMLQHGAVVAREYGKPCVAGIADVLSRLADGQTVEVDGTAGVVRVIADAALPAPLPAATLFQPST